MYLQIWSPLVNNLSALLEPKTLCCAMQCVVQRVDEGVHSELRGAKLFKNMFSHLIYYVLANMVATGDKFLCPLGF